MRLFTLLVGLLIILPSSVNAQSTWEQLSNHPSSGIERAFSFEIDGVIYVGGGRTLANVNQSRFRAYDVSRDSWTSKSNFPGGAVRNASGLAVGGFGYVVGGFDGTSTTAEFWKYDPSDDSWMRLDDFPGGPRNHPLTLASDSLAYVLLGGQSTTNTFEKDVWKFNPATDTWTELDDLPGSSRWRAFGWIIDRKMYVGGGARFPSQAYRDMYVFDLETETWNENRRANSPTRKAVGGFFFTIRGKGYYGEGALGPETGTGNAGQALYVYDPVTDEWTQEPDFIGPERTLGISVSLEDKAIIGLGRDYEREIVYRDMYSFVPSTTSSVTYPIGDDLNIFPNPISSAKLSVRGAVIESVNIEVTVFDIKGAAITPGGNTVSRISSDMIQLDVDHLAPGMYQIMITNGRERVAQRFVKH